MKTRNAFVTLTICLLLVLTTTFFVNIHAYDTAVATLQSFHTDLVTVNREVQFNFRDTVEPIYRQSVEEKHR